MDILQVQTIPLGMIPKRLNPNIIRLRISPNYVIQQLVGIWLHMPMYQELRAYQLWLIVCIKEATQWKCYPARTWLFVRY